VANQTIVKIIEQLINKVWFTRKAWIHAEKRLLRNEYHTQLLMVFYSGYATCLSVILLVFDPNSSDKKIIDTGLAVLSIILLSLSLYLNSKAFKDRAARFKVGYHDLQHIENNLSSLVAEPDKSDLTTVYSELAESYNNCLRDVENHDELDDLSNRISARSGLTSRKPTHIDVLRYYWWRCWRFAALTFFYLAPAAAVIWFFTK